MLIGSLIFHSLAVLSLDWNRSDAASLPKNNLGRENYYNFFQKTKNVFFLGEPMPKVIVVSDSMKKVVAK